MCLSAQGDALVVPGLDLPAATVTNRAFWPGTPARRFDAGVDSPVASGVDVLPPEGDKAAE